PRATTMPLRKQELIVEAIPQLPIDLSRIVEVKPAKGVAIVNEQMAVRNVQCAYGDHKALSERLSHREIHCRMAGKVVGRGVSVVKSRSVVDVPGDEGPPWKRSIKADIQCVAL